MPTEVISQGYSNVRKISFLPYFLIISFFLICVYYVLPVFHASHFYVCFVNISAYILTQIATILLNLFCTNSSIFVDVNVDVEYAIHSDLVLCNNFINYKVLPAFDFHFIGLESSQLIQTDLNPEKKYSNDYCFSLALFIFPIMFARVFLTNKHKRVKAFFGCIMFLLNITKPNLCQVKSISEIFTYESIDVCDLLPTCHIRNAFVFFALSKFKYRNKDSFFKLLLLLSGDISLNPGPTHMNQTLGNNEWNVFKT